MHVRKIGKDTSQKCDGYKAKIDTLEDGQAKEALITEQELHRRKAEAARDKKIKNIEEAKQSKGTKTEYWNQNRVMEPNRTDFRPPKKLPRRPC